MNGINKINKDWDFTIGLEIHVNWIQILRCLVHVSILMINQKIH